MLQFIKDLPDHVVGIRATGEVDKEDYEKVLIPRMEELVRRQGEIIIYWYWKPMCRILARLPGWRILNWA